MTVRNHLASRAAAVLLDVASNLLVARPGGQPTNVAGRNRVNSATWAPAWLDGWH